MKSLRFCWLLAIAVFAIGSWASAQSTNNTAQTAPTSDPQSVLAVQAAISAMGGTPPADSMATGTVVVVAGSSAETGTVRILSRGTDQSLEEMQLATEKRSVIYSRGQANELYSGRINVASEELVATSYSADFPLTHLVALLNDPETAFQYIGDETIEGNPVHHVRFWKTFASQPKLIFLSDFTSKDLWIDATTGLPRKLSYQRREAEGAVAPTQIEIVYGDWRNVGAIAYPYRVEKSWNGMPWATMTIDNVSFNNGLTDSDFSVQSAGGVTP